MNLEELVDILTNTPKPQPVFYRLYHDDHGNALFYSMQDVPGKYIEIDRDTYAKNSMRVRVVNGELQEVAWRTVTKLVPSTSGTACHKTNVAVVVDTDTNIKWSMKCTELMSQT